MKDNITYILPGQISIFDLEFISNVDEALESTDECASVEPEDENLE